MRKWVAGRLVGVLSRGTDSDDTPAVLAALNAGRPDVPTDDETARIRARVALAEARALLMGMVDEHSPECQPCARDSHDASPTTPAHPDITPAYGHTPAGHAFVPTDEITALRAEIARLCTENARLQAELHALRAATALSGAIGSVLDTSPR